MKKTTLLCVLDGLGLNPSTYGNAVAAANTPTLDELFKSAPHSTLTTHGELVGLPAGQMGNSEVGHLNMGAGRVVEQWLVLIARRLNREYLSTNANYQKFSEGLLTCRDIHLVGLFSDGGVHSNKDHLIQLIEILKDEFKGKIYLHLITDGRDVSPTRSLDQVRELEDLLRNQDQVQIASVCGRYHSMDRDMRWDRTEKAYRCYVCGEGQEAKKASDYIQTSYSQNIFDEFIEPAIINNAPSIAADSAVLFWNFRADRMRQLVSAICLEDFTGFARENSLPQKNHLLCFTDYEKDFGLNYLFEQTHITKSLGEVVADAGGKQIRIAETEKYPHVTYFFNGLSDEVNKEEYRSLQPSPRDVKTYDLKPEMSAHEVMEAVLNAIESANYDLIVVNFANCDMVGHTGVMEAAIKAVEYVDGCLGEILISLKAKDGQAVIIADHGNAEQMIKADGSPHTAHTTFPVPIILFNTNRNIKQLADACLADVAPTVLELMGLKQPTVMTGRSLLSN